MVDIKLGDVGNIFTSIREAFTGEKIKDPENMMELINELEKTLISAQARVIEAEAQSEHWIVASWRPLTMITFTFIIANNYVLVPYLNMFLSKDIAPLELTQNMWDLLKLGIGGYIVTRSAEKTMKHFKGK